MPVRPFGFDHWDSCSNEWLVDLRFAGSSRQLDWPSTIQIIRAIAQGLAYLQTMRVVHLDLKLENILFDSCMNPKISSSERSKLLLEQDATEIVSEELVSTM